MIGMFRRVVYYSVPKGVDVYDAARKVYETLHPLLPEIYREGPGLKRGFQHQYRTSKPRLFRKPVEGVAGEIMTITDLGGLGLKVKWNDLYSKEVIISSRVLKPKEIKEALGV